METERVRIARRLGAVLASGATDELADFVREDIVDHTSPAGSTPGRQGLVDAVEFYQRCFSDLDMTVDEVLEAGDRIVAYGIVTGTHTGPFQNLPPSGRRVSFAYMNMHRIVDGKITEAWHVEDVAGLLTQISAEAAAIA